jgi:hypothetical protein
MKTKDKIEMPITASTKQWFEVYLPLSAQPKRVLLPEKTNVRERKIPYCPIKVLGGSGDYIFTSRDVSVGKTMIVCIDIIEILFFSFF